MHDGNLCTTNQHLLVLDGHNSHVTIDVVHKAKKMGLDLITLPSHTSYALQPFNVACFKPFKTTFRAYMDVWTLMNKRKGAKKDDFAHWVFLVLKKTLNLQNIYKGFKTIRIWPLNLKAMLGNATIKIICGYKST
jgi:hypothetical protein